VNKKYAVFPSLLDNTSKHCATLAVGETIINDEHGVRTGNPDTSSPNGTITFIKSDGKVFGITCWHVINYLRSQIELSGLPGSYSFYTMNVRPFILVDSFIRPNSEFEYHQLDIGIRQVKSDFVSAIGKSPLEIDCMSVPDSIEFGLAVGFPERLKYERVELSENGSQVISLPTVSILAEIDRTPSGKFILYSEFESTEHHESYSGMSGGPILWSNEDIYGIFGITYEASKCEEFTNGKSIMIAGELATPNIIKHWISQIPKLYDDK
jgi:hypothetical protein